MDFYNYTYPTEIYHYGILGMRWGIRRYQNKDGTLTAAGKKKYAKLQAQSDKIEAKKRALVGDNEPDTPTISEDYARAHSGKSPKLMTDAELKAINTRLQQEKLYYETLSTVSKLTYKPTRMDKIIDGGKKAVSTTLAEWGTKAVKTITKRAIDKSIGKLLNKALGINQDEDAVEDNATSDNKGATNNTTNNTTGTDKGTANYDYLALPPGKKRKKK